MPVDSSRTVADLVIENPGRARVFEQWGIDYCCGGKQTLASACARDSYRLDDVSAALELADAQRATDDREAADWSTAPVAELCDHIVDVHHAYLRTELPRLSVLLDKCVRAHGDDRAELAPMQSTFEELRAELEHHMLEEEQRLFPDCRRGSVVGGELGRHLEDEHEAAGAALARLRALSGGYEQSTAMCNTHRATLDGLHQLETDLHRHIHEENNILFPRVIAAA
jgi:regulator of cell morphogenesis and NO signaling